MEGEVSLIQEKLEVLHIAVIANSSELSSNSGKAMMALQTGNLVRIQHHVTLHFRQGINSFTASISFHVI